MCPDERRSCVFPGPRKQAFRCNVGWTISLYFVPSFIIENWHQIASQEPYYGLFSIRVAANHELTARCEYHSLHTLAPWFDVWRWQHQIGIGNNITVVKIDRVRLWGNTTKLWGCLIKRRLQIYAYFAVTLINFSFLFRCFGSKSQKTLYRFWKKVYFRAWIRIIENVFQLRTLNQRTFALLSFFCIRR